MMKKIIYVSIAMLMLALFGCNTNSLLNHAERNMAAENKAQFWAERVNSMNGIEMAVVVINGDKALVEIEILGELTDEKLIPLKNAIEKMILDEDEDIKHVGVTAAPEIISRMAGEKPTDFNRHNNQLDDEADEKVMEFTPKI